MIERRAIDQPIALVAGGRMEGISDLKTRAESGDAEHQFAYGNALHFGLEGTEVDLEEAERWYSLAAAKNHPGALLNLGVLHMKDFPENGGVRNAAKARWYFEQAAKLGDEAAMYCLGESWYMGEGGEKNLRLALKWYVASANAGSGRAMNKLGLMCENGEGAPVDLERAFQCYGNGAKRDDASAKYNLARCYLLAIGAEADEVKAGRWFKAAAEDGLPDAQYNYAVMLATGNGVTKNESAAADWFAHAARGGSPQAHYELGRAYQSGRGVEINISEAARHFREAAGQDHPDAQFEYALIIEKGESPASKPDPAEAADWYRRAALIGHPGAAHNLGILYAKGEGVAGDGGIAKNLFEFAISRGEDAALFSMGLLLLGGAENLERDTEAACLYALLSLRFGQNGQGAKLLAAVEKLLEPGRVAAARAQAESWRRPREVKLHLPTLEVPRSA